MAVSKYIQSVQKAAGGRPRSTEWYRDKIREFGKPTSSQLIRDGKRRRNVLITQGKDGCKLNSVTYPAISAKAPNI